MRSDPHLVTPQAADPREAALRRLLNDDATSRPLDTLAELAREAAGSDLAMVTIVRFGEDRQCFRGRAGFEGALRDLHQTPLSRSFCKQVVMNEASLILNDAANDPRVSDNPAIEELGVAAYLGVPIHAPDGKAIGALCAIRHEPCEWDAAVIRSMERLALCVSELLVSVFSEYRAAFEADRARTLGAELSSLVVNVHDEIETPLRAISSLAAIVRSSQTGSDAVAMKAIEESAETAAQILQKATAPVMRETGDVESDRQTPTSSHRITVVAPDLQRRLAIRTELAKNGLDAIVRHAVGQALRHEERPDAIVLDATVMSYEVDQALDDLRGLKRVDSAIPICAIAYEKKPFEGLCTMIIVPEEDPMPAITDIVSRLCADGSEALASGSHEDPHPAATVCSLLPKLAS